MLIGLVGSAVVSFSLLAAAGTPDEESVSARAQIDSLPGTAWDWILLTILDQHQAFMTRAT